MAFIKKKNYYWNFLKKLKKLELSPQNSLSGVLHLLYSGLGYITWYNTVIWYGWEFLINSSNKKISHGLLNDTHIPASKCVWTQRFQINEQTQINQQNGKVLLVKTSIHQSNQMVSQTFWPYKFTKLNIDSQ